MEKELMNIEKFKNILKEEVESLLVEGTSSKILNSDKLNKTLKDYIRRRYDIDVNRGLVKDQDQYLTALLPIQVLEEENWNKFFKKYGYYVASKKGGETGGFSNPPPLGFYRIKLFPINTERVNLNDIIYHITPKNKLLKIKRKGLIPKKSSKWFNVDDPRIYFVSDENRLNMMIKDLKPHIENNPPFGNELAILKIDISEIDNNFFRDNEVYGSVFTRSNIPPTVIENWNDYEEELKILRKRLT